MEFEMKIKLNDIPNNKLSKGIKRLYEEYEVMEHDRKALDEDFRETIRKALSLNFTSLISNIQIVGLLPQKKAKKD